MVLAIVGALAASGCAHVDTRTERLSGEPGVSTQAQDIKIFKDSKPEIGYELIGKIESHIRRNIFWGGVARLDDEGYTELRQKAGVMGGNAVIIDNVIVTASGESTHIHIWATVIRMNS